LDQPEKLDEDDARAEQGIQLPPRIYSATFNRNEPFSREALPPGERR
jgi:hypothetical protein